MKTLDENMKTLDENLVVELTATDFQHFSQMVGLVFSFGSDARMHMLLKPALQSDEKRSHVILLPTNKVFPSFSLKIVIYVFCLN